MKFTNFIFMQRVELSLMLFETFPECRFFFQKIILNTLSKQFFDVVRLF